MKTRLETRLEKRPKSTLPSDLLHLYRSQDDTDVTFSFGSKELKAHKLILGARSDYFRRMFSTEMKENQTGVINIVDFDPEVFEKLIFTIKWLLENNPGNY